MRIQEQPQIVLPLRQYDALIARIAAEDHFVGIEAVVGGGGDAVGENRSRAEQRQHHQASGAQRVSAADLFAKQVSGPQRDAGVENPEDQRRANQAELGHQQNRKQQRCAQRAQIVEGQDVRDQLAELEALFQDAHQQRNFQADQRAHQDDDDVQDQSKRFGVGEGEEEHGGRESADQADHQFDGDEARH